MGSKESKAESQPVAHYMIRVSLPGDREDALRGVIERLGTGEKQSFATADELVRLVTLWPERLA